MNRFSYLFMLLTLICCTSFGQKKTLTTSFTKENIIIDGDFDEPVWETASAAKDFVMQSPDNGKLETSNKKTEVKLIYDNDAIYIAAKLYDDEPTKILKEISARDNFAIADTFCVALNGYNDGQQEFQFYVSASGVQIDLLYTEAYGEDYSWNAIWNSKVKTTDFGWVVEMKIPYAALRFSTEKKQTWGLNFRRSIKRDNQVYTWNFIDSKIQNISNQAGILEGIENISPPTRLFFIPYTSLYLNANDNQKIKGEFKGGLDIKYGINDAFTLDAILVPDFGQTTFDKVELNLSPFEQKYAENRPFFTEGTDLFSKGDLVYSRRIGGSPSYEPDVAKTEKVIQSTNKVNLINALKVSGRTKKGLGIGVLNAVTDNAYTTIKDTITGEVRKAKSEPLTNYNVLVLDQRFHKNSSVTFVNTNVTRNEEFRDANVTALVFDLNTKGSTYKLSGDYKYSYVNDYGDLDNKKGYNTTLKIDETNGKYRYGIGSQYISRGYDNNDLGINYTTHYHALFGNASFRILNPTKHFNSIKSNFEVYTEFENRTGRLQEDFMGIDINLITKKNDYFGMGINASPLDRNNFYEPRSDNQIKYVIFPKAIGGWMYFSSNFNRKFAIDLNPFGRIFGEPKRRNYGLEIIPRYRFSNKLSFIYDFNFWKQENNIGYIAKVDDDIIFARRNIISYTNSIQGKYSISNVMNINLSIRHYWSYAVNKNFITLQNDGTLAENTTYTENKNTNFNTWNLDLSYSWWFAPGSQISILYRNNSEIDERKLDSTFDRSYGKNFRDTFNHERLNHIFSISVRYFIDYNQAKHWF